MNKNVRKVLKAIAKDNGMVVVNAECDTCQYCGCSGRLGSPQTVLHKDTCIVSVAKKELGS